MIVPLREAPQSKGDTTAEQSPDYYVVELARLADGIICISVAEVTAAKDIMPQHDREVANGRLASLDEAFAFIKASLV